MTYICYWDLHVLMEIMQSLLKFAQRRNLFICDFIAIVKVYHGQLYNFYCDTPSFFYNDEFWSFQGLLQNDHTQIHMKWVTNYNTARIEHLAFVVNVEKTRVHWGEVCPSTSGMLHVTQTSFAHVVQLLKVECGRKCLPLLKMVELHIICLCHSCIQDFVLINWNLICGKINFYDANL